MAAKSLLLPKPRGKKKHSKTSWSSLLSFRIAGSLFPTSEPHGPLSIYLLQSLVVHSFLQSRMVSSFSPKTLWSSRLLLEPRGLFFYMAAKPRFKSQCPSSFAAPFLTPPTVRYTCQHPCILPALLGCHSKSGQVWPCGMEPIISKLSGSHCNQGGVASQLHHGLKSLPSPWLKAWPQLFNISMKAVEG